MYHQLYQLLTNHRNRQSDWRCLKLIQAWTKDVWSQAFRSRYLVVSWQLVLESKLLWFCPHVFFRQFLPPQSMNWKALKDRRIRRDFFGFLLEFMIFRLHS